MIEDRVSEFEEAYDAVLAGDSEEVKGHLLRERIHWLEPAQAISVEAGATVTETITLMREHHIGAVLVMEDGALVGIFTERDVLMKAVGRDDLGVVAVRELMTAQPETLRLDEGIAFALNKMHLGGFRHVPVLDAEQATWRIVSVRDVTRWIVGLFPDAVLNLPPDSTIRDPDKRGGA